MVEMDLMDRLTIGNGLVPFLTTDSQKLIVRALKKVFDEKGVDRGIEECAVTMRSLANQTYEARKRLREYENKLQLH